MSSIDWDALRQQAEDGTRPIPEGTYDVEVESATATTSSTGKPMIKLTYRIIGGPHATRQLYTQQTLSAESAFSLAIFFRTMEAHGLGKDFFAVQPPMERVAATMLGRRVRVDVGIRQFQGVNRNEIKNITGLGTTGPIAPTAPGYGPSVGAPGTPGVPDIPRPQVSAPSTAPTVGPRPIPPSTSVPTPTSPTGEAPPIPAF